LPTTGDEKGRYSVLILDLFHFGEESEEYTVEGFPTFALAKEYARRFVRSQIEETRQKVNGDPADIKAGWSGFGENALVLGGSEIEKYSGRDEVDFFIANPATGVECDYKAVLLEAGIKQV
jgi:hypothetical protein